MTSTASKPPICRLCRSAHWSNEQHRWSEAPTSTPKEKSTNGTRSRDLPRRETKQSPEREDPVEASTQDKGQGQRVRDASKPRKAGGAVKPKRPKKAKKRFSGAKRKPAAVRASENQTAHNAMELQKLLKDPSRLPRAQLEEMAKRAHEADLQLALKRQRKREQMQRYRERVRGRIACADG